MNLGEGWRGFTLAYDSGLKEKPGSILHSSVLISAEKSSQNEHALEWSDEDQFHEVKRCWVDITIWRPDHTYSFTSEECQVLGFGILYNLRNCEGVE